MKQSNKIPVGVLLWFALSCALHIVLFRHKLDMDLPVIQRLLYAVAAIGITLPLHEVIHCLFMRLFGLKDARIETGRDPLGLPSLRAVARGEVRGWRRTVIYLSPFLLLTVVPDILFFLNDRIALPFFIVAVSNAAGCCYDLMEIISGIRNSRSKR